MVVYENCSDQLRLCGKWIGVAEIQQQANSWRGATGCSGRSTRVDWAAGAAVHIHVCATHFLLDWWNRLAWKNGR